MKIEITITTTEADLKKIEGIADRSAASQKLDEIRLETMNRVSQVGCEEIQEGVTLWYSKALVCELEESDDSWLDAPFWAVTNDGYSFKIEDPQDFDLLWNEI
jgi:hypothetical protein